MRAGVVKRRDGAVFKTIKDNISIEKLSRRKVTANILTSRGYIPAIFQEQRRLYLPTDRVLGVTLS
jgi:hypothetical protein